MSCLTPLYVSCVCVLQEDLDVFSKGINRFQREDPTFRVHYEEESREVIDFIPFLFPIRP